MKRLFVLGCSFTNYAWPSWADMLGLEFDVYENWAYPGLGNRAIAERVAELHARETLTRDDTVIVQWTSHLRHDWHSNDVRHGKLKGVGWKTSGSIFNYINEDIFDKDWVKTFFDEYSYIMHSLNNILLTKQMLKSIGCDYYMTSMGYINKMNSDYPHDEDHGEKLQSNIDLWNDVPKLAIYKDKLFDDIDRWITPIGTYAWNHETKPYKFRLSGGGAEFCLDRHPTVLQHADYLKNKIKPKFGESQDLHPKAIKWIDKVNTLYENCHKDFDYFCEEVNNTLPGWLNNYRGF